MSGNPTYQDLAAWPDDKFRVADDSGIESLAFCPQSEQDVTATGKEVSGSGRVPTSQQAYNVATLG